MDLKSGQDRDGWLLEDFLGEGGNAEVWRCSRGGEFEAVKFLKTRNVESQAWARFVAEVEFLRSLGEKPGVLPILDFSLPDEGPARGKRAWYSMPLAVSLAAWLSDAPLSNVVEAIAEVADTLASILDEHETSHRDIKPGNLYSYEARVCVGDWGLLWTDEMAGLTAAGEITGPLSFTAPELFLRANENQAVDYQASDVFSLAKTLWALARGQQWALPGQHQLEDRVDAFRPHPRASTLDRLLVRATDLNPDRRPTMRSFADELRRWLQLNTDAGQAPSLSDIGELIRDRFAPLETRERSNRELSLQFHQLVDHAEQRLAPLYTELDQSIPRIQVRLSQGVLVLENLRGTESLGSPTKQYSFGTAARLSDHAEIAEIVLEFGMVIEAWDNGTTSIGAGFLLGRLDVLGAQTDFRLPEYFETGSVAEIEAVDQLVSWLISTAPGWLQRFAEVAGR